MISFPFIRRRIKEGAGEDFSENVRKGLESDPKTLSSRFFYDETGDDIFSKIMTLDEYYPTRCEAEILDSYKQQLLVHFRENADTFQLIELGAGDGKKTKILLKHFVSEGAEFKYRPVDISEHIVTQLKNELTYELPSLEVEPLAAEYFDAIEQIEKKGDQKKVVMFLGSSIGNFTKKQAAGFLSEVARRLTGNDKLLVGFDLKKEPSLIHNAYDDSQGVTRDFNFNLLHRINHQLGGNFRDEDFIHYPIYEPTTGEMKSYLIATREHDVKITGLSSEFHFRKWESVLTEISVKYELHELHQLAKESGLEVVRFFFDQKQYYTNALFAKR